MILQNLNRSHTILFDDPEDPDQFEPETLDATQIRNVADSSERFLRFLKLDIENGRTRSRFFDWNRRCDPGTTKQLVMMLANRERVWPSGMPRDGRALIQLYAGFQEFDCKYEYLCHSDGFLQASQHLIFDQELEDSAIAAEDPLQALVRGESVFHLLKWPTN
jgi:hypothetical protein